MRKTRTSRNPPSQQNARNRNVRIESVDEPFVVAGFAVQGGGNLGRFFQDDFLEPLFRGLDGVESWQHDASCQHRIASRQPAESWFTGFRVIGYEQLVVHPVPNKASLVQFLCLCNNSLPFAIAFAIRGIVVVVNAAEENLSSTTHTRAQRANDNDADLRVSLAVLSQDLRFLNDCQPQLESIQHLLKFVPLYESTPD